MRRKPDDAPLRRVRRPAAKNVLLMLSTILFTDALWLRVLLPLVALGVTMHIVLFKGRQSGE